MNPIKKPKIGIIGGHGRLGSWFARFFLSQGFSVVISDLHTQLKNSELVDQSDVVIFSVPIGVTTQIMEELILYSRPDQLWMDFTSIKSPAVETMLKSKAEVLGTHPMFGPSVSSIVGQTIVVCPERVSKWSNWFENILKQQGAKIKVSTPKDHDRFMAVIQALTHLTSITLNLTLKKLGVDIAQSLSYTSPIYRLHLDVGGRILAQDPRLYGEIQILNPEVPKVVQEYLNVTEELVKLIKDKDLLGFEKIFKEASDYLGPFKDEALKESDRLIETMVKFKNEG